MLQWVQTSIDSQWDEVNSLHGRVMADDVSGSGTVGRVDGSTGVLMC